MPTDRMQAFSDGVIAILITVMVLELKTPDGTTWDALRDVLPILLAYVLSFVYLGIYWNNHHHTLAVVERVSGLALWANLHLLFWLSLIPFTTGWMSENHFATVPTAAYGITLLCAGLAYDGLQRALIAAEGANSVLAQAIGKDLKGKLSPVLCVVGVALSFADRWLGLAAYVVLALMWLVPDRRVERTMVLLARRGDAAGP
jgi:uncharacterized membrane protein